MKKIIFLLFFSCTLLMLDAAAQRQNTYFLKNNGDYVTKADSADYMQTVQEAENIKFVILSTGEISDVGAFNDAHPELAAEAVRVIKSIKGWQVGIQKGRLVNVMYNVPISFMTTQ